VKALVSVVIPAHEEGSQILSVLSRLSDAVTLPCEVIVVVDSPTDSTMPYVEKYAGSDSRVRVIVNDVEPGPAQAIRYGFDRADQDQIRIKNMRIEPAKIK